MDVLDRLLCAPVVYDSDTCEFCVHEILCRVLRKRNVTLVLFTEDGAVLAFTYGSVSLVWHSQVVDVEFSPTPLVVLSGTHVSAWTALPECYLSVSFSRRRQQTKVIAMKVCPETDETGQELFMADPISTMTLTLPSAQNTADNDFVSTIAMHEPCFRCVPPQHSCATTCCATASCATASCGNNTQTPAEGKDSVQCASLTDVFPAAFRCVRVVALLNTVRTFPFSSVPN